MTGHSEVAMTLENITVGVDGSDCSIAALRWALVAHDPERTITQRRNGFT